MVECEAPDERVCSGPVLQALPGFRMPRDGAASAERWVPSAVASPTAGRDEQRVTAPGGQGRPSRQQAAGVGENCAIAGRGASGTAEAHRPDGRVLRSARRG